MGELINCVCVGGLFCFFFSLMAQDYMQYCTDVMSRRVQHRLSFWFRIALCNSEAKSIASGVQIGTLERQPETLLAVLS